MKTPRQMLTDFQTAMDQPVNGGFNKKELGFRMGLVMEEAMELNEASISLRYGKEQGEQEDYLKELCDVCYVLIGTAVSFGWDWDEAFRRVHLSNMSKLVDGKPQKDNNGKVIKGPNYQPPNLEDLV